MAFKNKAILILLLKQNNGPIAPKIINELPTPTKQVLVTDMLSKAKDPKDYQNREVYEFEQAPLNFENTQPPVLDHSNAPIAPAPKYRMTAETVEVKEEMGIDKIDGAKISTKMVLPISTVLLEKLWMQPLLLEQLREGMKEKKFCRSEN